MRLRRHAMSAFCGVAVLISVAGVFREGWPPANRSTRATNVRSPARVTTQDPENPCGPVCISIVSRVLGRPLTLAEANRLVRPDPLGRTTMAELVSALQSRGFGAAGVKLDLRACSRLEAPLIAHYRNSHFVVLVPGRSSSVVVLDPPRPPTVSAIDALSEEWDGACIVVAADPDVLDVILDELGISESG